MTTEPRTSAAPPGRATHALRGGADAEDVDAGYLAQRQLRSGTAGWVLLAGLGVSAVISGDYAGWNFGLAEGGFGGLLLATVLMAVMYGAMVLGLAELGSALPTAGGGYTFARRALGPWGGYATGVAVLIEYAIAPAAIATFIGAYVESLGLFGITDGWWVYLAVYALFIGVHLLGVGEALKVMLFVAVVAVAGLVVFLAGAVPAFDADNLLDIPVSDAAGASSFLPFGVIGIWAAFPFAIWFFLAVESVPLAAEEARDPAKAMPRGILAAMGLLVVLVASFFSIIYAYSRQTFALSRAGYLPRAPSVTNRRKAPVLALLVPGALGFVLSLTGQGAMLLNMAVFGATVSYVLMMVSHIVLRRREPDLHRPYRTPGGTVTTGVALVLAAAAVVATFLVDRDAALWTLAAYAAFLAYFGLYSRHHLVAAAPEEEFEALAAASRDVR